MRSKFVIFSVLKVAFVAKIISFLFLFVYSRENLDIFREVKGFLPIEFLVVD